MKTKSIIIVIDFLISFLGINAQSEKEEADFSELAGPYFGEKPPGMTPEIFAPGIISLAESFEHKCLIWDKVTKLLINRSSSGYLEAEIINNHYNNGSENIYWVSTAFIKELIPT